MRITSARPHGNVPEHAKAGARAVGEAAEAEPLASLQVRQDKGKVLHGHSIPHPVRTNAVRGGGAEETTRESRRKVLTFGCHKGSKTWVMFGRTPGERRKFNMYKCESEADRIRLGSVLMRGVYLIT